MQIASSEGFQHHFTIISKKKNVDFTLISFAVLKLDDCLSVQVPFQYTSSDTGSVASRARDELTRTIELEFELSRM